MRAFAILLLLANVAFFAWRYNTELQHRLTTTQPVAPLPADAPGLELLSELPQLPPPRSVEEPAAPDPGATLATEAPPPAATAPEPDAQAGVPDAANTAAGEAIAPASPAEAIAASEIPAQDAEGAVPAADAATPPTPASNAPQDVSAAEISGNGTPSDVCVSVGPFPRADDLGPLKRWLVRHATSMHVATRTVRKRQFFWLYLEASSDSAARRKVAELERKGVKDYLIIQRGGLKNAISLGLFASQDSVNKRLAEMNRQGYKPIVVPRIETSDLFWLRARLATGSEDIQAIPKQLYNGTAATTIDCSQIAAPGPTT